MILSDRMQASQVLPYFVYKNSYQQGASRSLPLLTCRAHNAMLPSPAPGTAFHVLAEPAQGVLAVPAEW